MKILINNNYILPISDEAYSSDPISIFNTTYSDTDLHLTQDFDQWISQFILNQHSYITDYTDIVDVNRRLYTIFNSPSDIQKLSYQLYPYQFDMTYNQWDNIKSILGMCNFYRRGVEETKFGSFTTHFDFFTKHTGKIIYL